MTTCSSILDPHPWLMHTKGPTLNCSIRFAATRGLTYPVLDRLARRRRASAMRQSTRVQAERLCERLRWGESAKHFAAMPTRSAKMPGATRCEEATANECMRVSGLQRDDQGSAMTTRDAAGLFQPFQRSGRTGSHSQRRRAKRSDAIEHADKLLECSVRTESLVERLQAIVDAMDLT